MEETLNLLQKKVKAGEISVEKSGKRFFPHIKHQPTDLRQGNKYNHEGSQNKITSPYAEVNNVSKQRQENKSRIQACSIRLSPNSLIPQPVRTIGMSNSPSLIAHIERK